MAEDFQPATIRLLQNRDRFISPRVVVTGKVLYKASQADGDTHCIIVDPSVPNTITTLAEILANDLDFVVCEEIPEIPLPNGLPPLHATVTIEGIARWDIEHGWPEVHPILSWTQVT